ncbi:YihY/virulence factor BrkB family protein [Candidatus Saccharibacteria bacterium]|nr:YihY/virulence factor BrkB family protein [Candidatus Saccharibacteria bacterium]
MNVVEKAIQAIDRWQRRHKGPAFAYAVLKKYDDDQTGYLAALVTYYGFIALFPLLLVTTTVLGMIGFHHQELGRQLVNDVSKYFPVAGQSLDNSIRGFKQTGPALIIGLLVTFYGARGVADAFRHAVCHIWHVPKQDRSGFPRNLIRSFGIIVGGGGGFLLASALAGWAGAVGTGILFRSLSVLLNIAMLYLVFMLVFTLSLPRRFKRAQYRTSALISAVGLTALQLGGAALFAHTAKGITTGYSAIFATTLIMLTWIYLQVRLVLYAVQIDTVKDGNLYPRSLSGKHPTEADNKLKP